MPIVLAAAVWGHNWEELHVCFHCDNQAEVQVLTSRSSKEPIIRCYFFCSAYFKISYSASHIAGSAADEATCHNFSL